MSRYYDRQGQPLTLMEWAHRFEDWDYKRIAQTVVGKYNVSTVWLGADHQFGEGPPLIFETMVFPGEADCERYTTEQEALAGHAAMVAKWKDKPAP